jgi:hypothetical protein
MVCRAVRLLGMDKYADRVSKDYDWKFHHLPVTCVDVEITPSMADWIDDYFLKLVSRRLADIRRKKVPRPMAREWRLDHGKSHVESLRRSDGKDAAGYEQERIGAINYAAMEEWAAKWRNKAFLEWGILLPLDHPIFGNPLENAIRLRHEEVVKNILDYLMRMPFTAFA